MPLDTRERKLLIELLAELVGRELTSDYARGLEAGMSLVMVVLGINEVACPERHSLRKSDQ